MPDTAGGSAPQSTRRHCLSTRLMSRAGRGNAGWREKKISFFDSDHCDYGLFFMNPQDCSVNTASSDDSETCRCLMATPQLWGFCILPFLPISFLHLSVEILNSGIRLFTNYMISLQIWPLSTQSRALQVNKSLNCLKNYLGRSASWDPFCMVVWWCSLSTGYNSAGPSESPLTDSHITSESISNTLMSGSNTQMKFEGTKADSGMQDPLNYASMHEL